MRTKKGREKLARLHMMYARSAVKHLTKARTRRLAHTRAIKRYETAVKRAGWQISPRGCLIKGDPEAAKALPAA